MFLFNEDAKSKHTSNQFFFLKTKTSPTTSYNNFFLGFLLLVDRNLLLRISFFNCPNPYKVSFITNRDDKGLSFLVNKIMRRKPNTIELRFESFI